MKSRRILGIITRPVPDGQMVLEHNLETRRKLKETQGNTLKYSKLAMKDIWL